MPVRIIVCGGRDYSDKEHVFSELDRIHKARIVIEVIEGGARGADGIARDWAITRGIKYTTVHADWERLKKSAGPVRNREMLSLKPDGVVAFPGGRGTADMCKAARESGVPVMMIRSR